MIFPNEKKKELWRYASKNSSVTCDGVSSEPPQLQRLPPPHLLPGQATLMPWSLHTQENPQFSQMWRRQSLVRTKKEELTRSLNTPPPPYTLMPYTTECSCSESVSNSQRLALCRQRQQKLQQMPYRALLGGWIDGAGAWREAGISVSGSEELQTGYAIRTASGYINCGCSYESSGNDVFFDENNSSAHHLDPVNYSLSCHSPLPTTVPHTPSTSATNFAITAANMFRNCCGGGNQKETSSNGLTTTGSSRRQNRYQHKRATTNSTSISSQRRNHTSNSYPADTSNSGDTRKLKQDFDALMKQLKSKQIGELLLAIRSRQEPLMNLSTIKNGATTGFVYPSCVSSPSYLQCILLKPSATITPDEEQHLTICRLFFWSDLKNSGELRRLPICTSAYDYVYVCCNPLHWFRIVHPIDAETAPPPYQRSKKMLRLRDSDCEEKSNAAWNSYMFSPSNNKIFTDIKRPNVESFTTEVEDFTAFSKIWCQIAYWELGQRVGEFFQAKNSLVNIYTDGPIADCLGEKMCLYKLAAKRISTDTVINTRQKIGLGVTINREQDDVWIYNRGNAPIFVDSPTLSERLDRVCKVMPGCCIKAFDTYRAQILAHKQSTKHLLGPVDQFSMKISFAKGWGNTYRRQDIMGCPCWLEVHFSQL